MAVYAVGDVQGCLDELQALLTKLAFDASSDRIWFVGDLVNRGPKSLETLRFVRDLGDAAVCVLGNHDLHLVAIALADRAPAPDAELKPVLAAPDAAELIDWLRQLPLAHHDAEFDTLMVHAGVVPDWSVNDVLAHAADVAKILRGPAHREFLQSMYGDKPDRWSEQLSGIEKQRFVVNCLTRIRYCTADGRLNFKAKQRPGKHSPDLIPWFDLPNRRTAATRVVFGHWSTLGFHTDANVVALDTGCVWGGPLTAIRLDANTAPIQVPSFQPLRF